MSYVPMSYEPSSYAPVSSVQPRLAIRSEGYEKEGKAKSSRLSGMFSRWNGKRSGKTKKSLREEEDVEVKAYNDWMDEDY